MSISEPWGAVADTDDTTALLQEEIARLEDELRLRDEALIATRADGPTDWDRQVEVARERRIHELELVGNVQRYMGLVPRSTLPSAQVARDSFALTRD